MVFHNINFYSTTLISDERYRHISMPSWYRPYIRGFRQSYFKHSDLGYFVDLRPIGSTVHLWTAFVGLVIIQQSIRLLSADFTELLTGQFSLTPASRSIKGAFQGVIPSFHLLDC